jgi:magnesium transporter
VVEHPELERRHEVFHHFPTDKAVAFIQAMSPDQQAHLFRRLPDADRTRFLEDLDASTRATLALLLAFPPTTAGGIMTTDYLSVPSTATAGEALDHVAHVGRRKPVYAIYVLDPGDRRVVHVVSLRELVVAERRTAVLEVGEHRGLLKVAPMADREDVARLLSKYNLLAVPVVDEHGHLLGTITVDDVIDAVVKEQTEDLHKMGGLEALDEPYSQIAFGTMIRYDYGPSWPLVALTVGAALVGVVTFGSLAGAMLPFILRRLDFDPASASAPFVATLVDVTGLIIYFGVALLILHGTLL